MIENRPVDLIVPQRFEFIDSIPGQTPENPIPCTSIIVFNGENILVFEYAKGTTVGERKIGLPGGHGDIDLRTGRLETPIFTGQRELGEEARMIVRMSDLVEYEGNEYVANMGKDGMNKWMKMTAFYTHQFYGEPRHVQPEEGRPFWMHHQRFLNLPDETGIKAAPNTQKAVLDAMRHSANSHKNGIYIP